MNFLMRIFICFILGLFIGIERQYRRRVAGIRTITLVSLGSFLFVSASFLSEPNDITRIAAQVVSGIGFLGAGVIIRDGTNIKGLNTAATLWCSAAIGTLTALGYIYEACIGVSFILLSNIVLRVISKKIMIRTEKINTDYYSLIVICDKEKELFIKDFFKEKIKSSENYIKSFSINSFDDKVKIEFQIEVLRKNLNKIKDIINKLCLTDGINSISFNKVVSNTDDDDDYEVK